jgi:nicotinate-nucleotide adenylyltransferase
MVAMRLAIFGGSFDPPHRGHLVIARAALERLNLDLVWMAPAGTQPLKLDSAMTSYADRLAMVALAVEGEARIVASDIDAPRGDGWPSYTIDLLRRVRAELDGEDELFFLLGADAFLTLEQWHGAAELPFLCRFIVAGRPGSSLDDVPRSLPQGIQAVRKLEVDSSDKLIAWELRNLVGAVSALYFMPDLQVDISATEIRAAIGGDQSAAHVLAPAVLRYIEARGLYRDAN